MSRWQSHGRLIVFNPADEGLVTAERDAILIMTQPDPREDDGPTLRSDPEVPVDYLRFSCVCTPTSFSEYPIKYVLKRGRLALKSLEESGDAYPRIRGVSRDAIPPEIAELIRSSVRERFPGAKVEIISASPLSEDDEEEHDERPVRFIIGGAEDD